MEVAINELCDLLQNHANRDKVVCLSSYVLKLWGGAARREGLLRASARLAGARATTRLFDDAAAIKALYTYGLGKQDGPFWGPLGALGALSTLGYLQAEKVVWLMDTGVVQLPPTADARCRVAHKLCWSLLATVGLIRSIRALHQCAQEMKCPERRRCAQARFTQASLTTTKLIFDVAHSVSWLPPGWLWGGTLNTAQAGGVATVSAVLALVIHYHGKKLAPAKVK